MVDHYRVIVRPGEDAFEVVYEPSGEVLLLTQNVSLQTLVEITGRHWYERFHGPLP